jgi:hypothetical protein
MRVLIRLVILVATTVVAFAACGGSGGGNTNGAGARKSHAAARILIKKDGGVCKSRTIPQHHMLLKDDENEIVWDVKVKDGCLSDSDVVLKWTVAGKNPTTCNEISSADSGQSKTRLHCDLTTTFDVNYPYVYKVYLRKGGVDTVIEDPDVEIVTF